MGDIFSGKKAMCFIALQHHNRLFFPIMQALKRRGMEVVYFTAAAESAFEITLQEAGLPYLHPLDYADAEVQAQIQRALREIQPRWRERVLDNPILQAAPLPIQDKNNRSVVESLFCFKRMLEVEKPDLLFGLHELNSWGKTLGYLSHELRIPYITLQEGYYFGSPPFYRFHTDYSTACVVWGEFKRDLLIRGGCSPDKLVPLGNIDLWGARAAALEPKSIAATREELGIGAGKKIILFLMCHANYAALPAQRLGDWLKARGDTVAVFKWHPVTGPDVIQRATETLKSNPFVISTQTVDTYKLMGASGLCVIVGTSTTGMEALAFGKPLVEIRLPDRVFSFAAQGLAEPAEGFERVAEKIEAILQAGVPQERKEKIEEYLNALFAYRDDKTAERIADMAGEMLQARARLPLPAIHGAEADRVDASLILPVDDSPTENLLATLQGISKHLPASRYEVVIVNCATREDVHELLGQLDGDVTVIPGDPRWNFAEACNLAAARARGRYLTFLKPGIVPLPGWLEGLLQAARDHHEAGAVGGGALDSNGLIWHIGTAFDVNQSPFSLYRMLPADFEGAQGAREFRAVEHPFLVARERFCRLGGFSTDLANRFEDIDLCLRLAEEKRRIFYTPASAVLRAGASWLPSAEQNRLNGYRFYARWTGWLWQDDDVYLKQDGLDWNSLSARYRELAARLASDAEKLALATRSSGSADLAAPIL